MGRRGEWTEVLVEIAQCDWEKVAVKGLGGGGQMLRCKIVMFSTMKMEPL